MSASFVPWATAIYAGGLLVTRPGADGARWIDPVTALAWLEGPEPAIDALSRTRGAPPEAVRHEVETALAAWLSDPLFSAPAGPRRSSPPPGALHWDAVVAPGTLPVRLICRHAGIAASLDARLERLDPALPVVATVEVRGDETGFVVTRDGRTTAYPDDETMARSAAMLATIAASHGDLPVLSWLHAGAVLGPRGVVALCGRGGSGKSTLCAGLAATGRPLLSDDLVPLEAGTLEVRAVRMHAGIRPGSVSALLPALPELAGVEPVERDGEPVHPWRPRPEMTAPVDRSWPMAALVFPTWSADAAPCLERLGPIAKLEALVSSWSGVPRTTGDLAAFARWLEPLPAWRIGYADLTQAIGMVERIEAELGCELRAEAW